MPHHPSKYGTPTTLPIDFEPGGRPGPPGTVFASDAGAFYLLESARRVDSSKHPNRWRLDVIRLDPDDVPDEGPAWQFHWHQRR